jgi:ABC-2 type transport system ATP-binding protein
LNAASFENVVKTYKTGLLRGEGVPALRGATLAVPAGSTFALLGPNRAGKTTLVKLLLSLCSPTSGIIKRFDAPISDRSTLGRIGYMHENHAFPRYLSATELLHFYGGLSGIESDQLPVRVESLLQRVGLADRKSEPIARFSKGMVQRLGMAQALINEPDLLILDEPTEGLDLFGRNLLRQVVREFKSAGRTVLLVSHVLAEVEELCDRVAVLVNGVVVHHGTMHDLLTDSSGRRRSLEAALRPLYERGVAA